MVVCSGDGLGWALGGVWVGEWRSRVKKEGGLV
jgi:hypothetical protein